MFYKITMFSAIFIWRGGGTSKTSRYCQTNFFPADNKAKYNGKKGSDSLKEYRVLSYNNVHLVFVSMLEGRRLEWVDN